VRVLVATKPSAWAQQLPQWLQDWGYEVTSTSDGNEALKILQADNPPPLLLAEWQLPGIDGTELCRLLSRTDGVICTYAILLTPPQMLEQVADLLQHGAGDFILCPPESLELRSRLAAGYRIMSEQNKLRMQMKMMEELAESRFRQLIHADRLAALGTMAAGVAHEISTPLAFICSSVELLEMYWDDLIPTVDFSKLPEQRAGLLQSDIPKVHQTILRGVERINGLVSTLNTFSRRGDDTFIKTDLHECLNNARELCINVVKYTIDLQLDLDADLPEIRVRPRQIEQVLINLIKNAADAINANDETEGVLRITTTHTDDAAILIVEDSGPGIPPEHIDKVWEAFYTTKAAGKGTGLGLPITRGIIEDHGGTIILDTSPLGGARFTINLPFNHHAGQSEEPELAVIIDPQVSPELIEKNSGLI